MLLVAACFGAVFAAGPPAAQAQKPMSLDSPLKPVNSVPDSVPVPELPDPAAEGFQALVVEIRAGQEEGRSEFAFAREGAIWVPAVAVFNLVELRASVDSLGVLSSLLEPEGFTLNLYPREREAWRGNYYRITQERDLFLNDGVLYCKASDLAWVLDVQLYEDFTEMVVVFDNIDRLPLGRRLHRERMRHIESLYGGEPDIVYEAERPAWSGATVDWNVGVSSIEALEQSNFGLGFGGALFGGALDARYRGRVDGRGPETLDARWQQVWPDEPWLKQLEVGSTRSAGPRGHAIDGVFLSNSPFLRSSSFGETVLNGRAEPGWEVEIYRDGRLIAWDRVDDRGNWEFLIGLDYGQNPVEVRVYGPNGEVQITERAVRVDFDRIPSRTVEYALSAGTTDFRGAEFASNADLRYGINRHWTARAGYEGYQMVTGADEHHPYAALTGSVIDPVRVGAERVGDAWWWTGASLEPSSDFRLGSGYYRYDRNRTGSLLVNPGELDRLDLDAFWRPIRQRRNLFFEFDAEQLRNEWGRETRTATGVTTMLGPVRTSAQLKEEFDRSDYATFRHSALALQGSYILRSADRDWWHGIQLRLQSELDTGIGRDDWVQMSLGRRLGRSARLEVGGGWFRATQSTQFMIGISSTGSHAYVNASMIGRDGQGMSSRMTAEGSLLYEPQSGTLETYPFRSLGRGGLSGTVFVDGNGNGRFDTGEETVAGARLVAGHFVAETDESGRYSIWNLVPFEGADIQVEPNSLSNPMWVPAFELAEAAVSPNGFRRIDLPLVLSLELEGRVRTRVGEALMPSGSVPIRLVQIEGEREYQNRCFSDGEFYLVGVVPGHYRVEVDPHWLDARGLKVAADSAPVVNANAGSQLVHFEVVLETSNQTEDQ